MKPREFIFPLRLGGGMARRGAGAAAGNAGESDYAVKSCAKPALWRTAHCLAHGCRVDRLALMMRGKNNKVICRMLHLAEPTVKNHVTAILRTLKVTNRTGGSVHQEG
jgi:hypothetical protein